MARQKQIQIQISSSASPAPLPGDFHLPTSTPPFPAALLLHPYPPAGGSKDHPLIFRLAHTLAEHHIAALRFNFPGATPNTSFSPQTALASAEQALSFLTTHPQVAPHHIALIGYSFGAWIAAQLASQSPCMACVLIAPPLALFPHDDLLTRSPVPKLVLAPQNDIFCPPAQLHSWLDTLAPPRLHLTLPDSDHFLIGKGPIVTQHVLAFLQEQIE